MSRFEDQGTQTGGEKNQGQQGGTAAIGQNLRDVGQQAKQVATDQMNQVRDQAQQYYEQGRDMAQQYYDQGRETAQEWEQNLEDYVRQQPIKSVMIAAGIGLVLGFIWRRS